MPKQERFSTKYVGVYYIIGTSPATGKPEKIFYARYRSGGKVVEEKIGYALTDDMTPAKASHIRAQRIKGKELPNTARRKAEEAARRAEEGKWTIARLWKQYKENKPNLKGLVTDENRFRNYISPAFSDMEPSEIDPLSVDRLRLAILKKRSKGTARNTLELLRRICNYGAKKNLCPGLNFTIEMPHSDSQRTEDLNPKQLQNLIDAIETADPQVGNLMKLALFTGMRRGELFRLQWDDVDFSRGFIHLRSTKSGQDHTIPLNEAAKEILISHPKIDGSPYVFPGRGGLQRKCIKKQVNAVRDKAGLPKDFRALHGLRHVFASMLASTGKVDMYVLQKLLTHKSPAMTARYAHLRNETLQKASELAGEIVSQIADTEENEARRVINIESHRK